MCLVGRVNLDPVMGVVGMDSASSAQASCTPVYTCQKCGCPCSSCGSRTRERMVSGGSDAASGDVLTQMSHVLQAGSHVTHHQGQVHHHHHHVTTTANLDLQHQIEVLNARLKQNNEHIEKLEHSLSESRQQAQGDAKKIQTDMRTTREKYERLMESHKHMQRVNQMLEEKILGMANRLDQEKTGLQTSVASLTTKLQAATSQLQLLESVNESLRNDCSLAVRLLQCRSSYLIPHRLEDLPTRLQDRVKANLTYDEMKCLEEAQRRDADRSGGLLSYFSVSPSHMSTFPPSAMALSSEEEWRAETAGNAGSQAPESVVLDMGDDDGVARGVLPASIFTRVFGPTASHAPGASRPSHLRTHSTGSRPASSITPEQEKLLLRYSDQSLPPESLQYYMCKRCRIQCVTSDKWVQTSIGPIYSGAGPQAPSTDPPSSLFRPSSSFSVMPSRDLAASPPPQGLPHASTFPDLITSVEERRGKDSAPQVARPSSHLLLNEDSECDLLQTLPNMDHSQFMPNMDHSQLNHLFSYAPPKIRDPSSIGTCEDRERRRHDSETGSVSGGGWGDIHIGGLAAKDQSASFSAFSDNSGCSDTRCDPAASFPHASSSTAQLTTCLEEIDLNEPP